MLNIYYRVCLLALCLLFLVSCNKLSENSSICGNWDGIYNCHEISFVFNCLSKCTLKYLNNKSNEIEVINGNYELDFSKKPILLSIRNISQLNYSIYTIIEFPDEDLMKIANFSPKWKLRPIAFETGKTITLKRASLAK